MCGEDIGAAAGRVERVLANLAGETMGALVIVGQPDGRQWLIDRAAHRGLAREPLYVWHDAQLSLPQARRTELLYALLDNNFHEVRLAPGVEIPRDNVANKWCELAALPRWQRAPFEFMQPAPVRFFATFGPNLDGSGGQPKDGAPPGTRLVFALSAGLHTLRSTLQMSAEAYRQHFRPSHVPTPVEVTLLGLGANGGRSLLGARDFCPRHNREDRGKIGRAHV